MTRAIFVIQKMADAYEYYNGFRLPLTKNVGLCEREGSTIINALNDNNSLQG